LEYSRFRRAMMVEKTLAAALRKKRERADFNPAVSPEISLR